MLKSKNQNTTLKWIATIFTVLGVYITAISPVLAATSPMLFVMLFVAHVIWAIYGFHVKEQSLLWMNILLLPVDLYGILIRV